MVISYNIINTGDGPAYNIEIIDSYQSSSFEVSSVKPEGDLIVLNIDEIAPQDSKSINVTVIPRVPGMYHPDKARIKYSGGADIVLETEDDEEENEIEVDLDSENPQEEEKVLETGRIGYSNHMSDIEIQDSKSYYNSKSWHVTEICAYLFLSSTSILVPYVAHRRLANDRLSAMKKKK